ncbi:MAG TPA: amino acid permease, partial [Flavilitoribacter sp.]|nr:amino acid permease [Flavilitoribacter sp.]
FALYPEDTCDEERKRLFMLIQTGKLPISPNNIEVIPKKQDSDPKAIISDKSKDADLTILGFRDEIIRHEGIGAFEGYEAIGNILFVNASEEKSIK